MKTLSLLGAALGVVLFMVGGCQRQPQHDGHAQFTVSLQCLHKETKAVSGVTVMGADGTFGAGTTHVTYEFLGNSDGKDRYLVEWRGPNLEDSSLEIAYEGGLIEIFDDEEYRISAGPAGK